MKEVSCGFCGSPDGQLILEGTDTMFRGYAHRHRVLRCRGCGLIYLTPRPSTAEEYLAMYPPGYDSYADLSRPLLLALRRFAWRSEFRRIRRRVGRNARIVELGTATGEYLAALRDTGSGSILGIEFNPAAAGEARRRHGLEVITGDLLEAGLPSCSADLLLARYVLEHVPNPVAILSEVSRLLAADGWFRFSIPNPESWDAMLLGKYWFGHEIPRHFHNYPRATLEKMLATAGMELAEIEYSLVPNDWILGIRNVLIGCGIPWRLANLCDIWNPIALAFFTPLGVVSGIGRGSGRIHCWARKSDRVVHYPRMGGTRP